MFFQTELGRYVKDAQDPQSGVNGKPSDVFYAGAAPGAVAGLFQVNARIPADTPSGDVPLEIHVGDAASQPGLTLAVE